MDIEAFILIGGRSSRLGVDKAFVQLGGETLASRAARIIAAGIAPRRTTFVAASTEQFDADRLSALGLPIVSDLKPGFGGWSGLCTALAVARSQLVLVLACDLPSVSTELLRLIVAATGDEFDAAVPTQPDGRLQPLCCVYRREPALAAVEAILANDHELPPLASIVERLRARVIGADEYAGLPGAEKFFTNINTPADLDRASLDEAADPR